MEHCMCISLTLIVFLVLYQKQQKNCILYSHILNMFPKGTYIILYIMYFQKRKHFICDETFIHMYEAS